jgi:hypothetical protein
LLNGVEGEQPVSNERVMDGRIYAIDPAIDLAAFSPGSYALDVRTRDAAGNIDPTAPWVRLTVARP